MSNTDTLKQGYEAFGRGDLDGATENFADDIAGRTRRLRRFRTTG